MNEKIKYCELNDDKLCDDCNECNMCDLTPNKVCDNCCKCIDGETVDYREIKLEGIIEEEIEVDDYLLKEDLITSDEEEMLDSNGVEYIEDIPELKEKYKL